MNKKASFNLLWIPFAIMVIVLLGILFYLANLADRQTKEIHSFCYDKGMDFVDVRYKDFWGFELDKIYCKTYDTLQIKSFNYVGEK